MGEWYDSYSAEIKEKIKGITCKFDGDIELFLLECEKLREHAKQNHDHAIMGVCYYYEAEYAYETNEFIKAIEYSTKCIYYLGNKRLHNYQAKAYNVLGIVHYLANNYTESIENFFMAIRISKEENLVFEQGLVLGNLACLYQKIGDYDAAIQNYKRALESHRRQTVDKVFRIRMNIIIGMGFCYLAKEDIRSAYECNEEVEKLLIQCPKEDHYQIMLEVFRFKLYHMCGEYEKEQEYAQRFEKELEKSDCVLQCIDEIADCFIFLLHYQKLDMVAVLLPLLEKHLSSKFPLRSQLSVLDIKMTYYDMIQDDTSYLITAKQYQRINKEYNRFINRSNIDTINTKSNIEELQIQNELILREQESLEKKSKIDALTGLPNRAYLDEYSKQQFEYAKVNSLTYGVVMLDIDYFKQYNDYYGHQQGDECIKKVSQVLRGIMDNNLFCARYGGDEFILISVGYSLESIEQLLKEIKHKVNDMKLCHEKSIVQAFVTISQGAYVKEIENQSLYNYLNCADKNLYQVKRISRNDYLVTDC